ncbi:MAG: type III pantothenate kinase [Candidatus Omnitrophica bacterium]|nr:type III pantothenate kinase [Candidatus Omnitrophota bacterium]
MLLALDVGNTSITVGLFRGRRLVAKGRIPTHGASSYSAGLRGLLRKKRIPPGAVRGVILSSVVPQATRRLKKSFRGLGLPRPLVVGQNVEAPVTNRYRIPSQVGQDRLVNAAAAFFLYGGPAIVVDFGTAITIDVVSGRREYLGGLIVPGMEISLNALAEKTALLPKVKLGPAKELLGRDTVSSMKSGILFGYSALCDGVVERLKQKYVPKAKVIATGGQVKLIAPHCRMIDHVSPTLTLQGLELTYRKKSS